MATPQAAPAANPYAVNAAARNAVIQNALDMWQVISTQTLVGTVPGQVINIPLRNVGLIKKLVVEVSFDLAQSAAETLSRTMLSGANIFSNVQLTDLSNNTRINTTGWHLHLLATARRSSAYGAAFTSDSPVGIGSNFPVMNMPASITTTQRCRFFVEIPIAYGDNDLRGAIYAAVVNATMNVQLTVNPNFVVATAANGTEAVYKSSTSSAAATPTNMQIKVYQNYLDQLPVGQRGPILPLLDLSTAYLLNQTAFAGLAVDQDNPIPYANFREFQSTTVLYDNFGSSTAVGAEFDTWSMQTANYTNVFKIDPYLAALWTRNRIGDDMPGTVGSTVYYFDHRQRPVNTIQFGNMQLVAKPNNVASASSRMLVGWESFAKIDMIVAAGSLAANQ